MATRAERGSGCGCWLTRAAVRKHHERKKTTFMNAEINTTRDLVITAIDLTRAYCAHENYFTWLSMQRGTLSGSAEIANYFASAAIAFEEQAHPTVFADFEAFDARDNLADILMTSAPLTSDELRTVVTHAIREVRSEEVPA